jgi:hypothetical protein
MVLAGWRFVVTAFALLLLASPNASASRCGAACREQGKVEGWSRADVGACTKACKREQQKCRGTRGSTRAECQRDSATCARQCGSVWGQSVQRQDRQYCQFVCGSCGRADIGFCVAGQFSGSPTAQCCGGPDRGPCCTWLGSPDVADCCATGTTCCSATGCTDTTADTQNCGGCGVRCVEDDRCVDGTCVADRGGTPPAVHPCIAEGGEGWTTTQTTVGGQSTVTNTYTCSALVCETSDNGARDCFRNCSWKVEFSDGESTKTSLSYFRGNAFTQSPIDLPRCTDQGSIAWLSGGYRLVGTPFDTIVSLTATRCATTVLYTLTPQDFVCCSSIQGFVPTPVIDGCPS